MPSKNSGRAYIFGGIFLLLACLGVWLFILTGAEITRWTMINQTFYEHKRDQDSTHNLIIQEIKVNHAQDIVDEDIIKNHDKLKAKVELLDASINGEEKRKARINQTIAAIKAMLPVGGNYLKGCPKVPSPGELWSIAGAIIDNADHYAVPPAFIAAVIRQESAFCNKAVSKAGAKGYMQLMPDTAAMVSADVAVKTGRALRTWRGRDNIQLGTAYLSHMLMEFDGDVVLAAAGYNAGPNHVKKVLAGERSGYHEETEKYIELVVEYKEEFEKLGLQ